jgi:hypothetical protein
MWFSVKRILKFFHFFGAVADVVTFGLYDFEKFFGLQKYSRKYFQIKIYIKILKNIMISLSRNTHFTVLLLLPLVSCMLSKHQENEVC